MQTVMTVQQPAIEIEFDCVQGWFPSSVCYCCRKSFDPGLSKWPVATAQAEISSRLLRGDVLEIDLDHDAPFWIAVRRFPRFRPFFAGFGFATC